jgi:hypothetical protein
MDQELSSQSLRRILNAYCVRNPGIGYAQGMTNITLFLLSLCGNEKLVFSLVCLIVEQLRFGDFYQPPPQGMAGFIFQGRLLEFLVRKRNPNLVARVGFSALNDALMMLNPKWLILKYIDSIAFHTTLVIWDYFFRLLSDVAHIVAGLALLAFAEPLVLAGEELIVVLTKGIHEVKPEWLFFKMAEICASMYAPDFIPAPSLSESEINKLLSGWNRDITYLVPGDRPLSVGRLRQVKWLLGRDDINQFHCLLLCLFYPKSGFEHLKPSFEMFFQRTACGGVTGEAFTEICQLAVSRHLLTGAVLPRLFLILDRSSTGALSFRSLLYLFSIMVAGSFQVYISI